MGGPGVGRTWDARGLDHELEEASWSPKALQSSFEAFLADMLDVQAVLALQVSPASRVDVRKEPKCGIVRYWIACSTSAVSSILKGRQSTVLF
jgi:hypothetical protein